MSQCSGAKSPTQEPPGGPQGSGVPSRLREYPQVSQTGFLMCYRSLCFPPCFLLLPSHCPATVQGICFIHAHTQQFVRPTDMALSEQICGILIGWVDSAVLFSCRREFLDSLNAVACILGSVSIHLDPSRTSHTIASL